MSRIKSTLLALLVILPLAATALERTQLLPPEVQLHVRVSDTTAFWAKLKLSSLGKLWADPQFQDFLGNPDAETWQELFFNGTTEAEDQVFLEQLKMLSGEVILAFEAENQNPCIIAAMSREDFLRSMEMDDKLAATMDDPFEIVKSTFQGVEIVRHIEDGGTAEESSSWQTHVDGTFVLGHTREWIEQCIVKLKKDAIKEPTGHPALDLNIPLAKLIRENLLESMKEDAPAEMPFDPETLLEALGLLGIENFTARIELRDTEMIVDNTLQVSDLTKGLFTIFDVEPSQLPSVSFIPENISSLEVGRFNILRFWQEIPVVLNSAMPAMKPQFDMILAMVQQQAGIDLEQDLLANLGTKYVSFAVAEGGQQNSIIAIELRDTTAYQTALETMLSAPALQPQVAQGLEIETFLDHTIYTTKNPDPSQTAAFCVAADHLIYGQPAAVRQVIRAATSDVDANRAFEHSDLLRGLRDHVPARAFGFSAVDWKKSMEVLVRELSKPQHAGVIQQNWAKSGSALPPPDFSKLPATDHLASFFNVSYQYSEATPAGIHQKIILKY